MRRQPDCTATYGRCFFFPMPFHPHEDNYEDIECTSDNRDLEEILKDLLDEAVKRGIIEDSITYRDLFDTKIMNCLMPRPSQIQKEFQEKYNISPEEATSYYYKLSQDSDYIRRYRIKKDRKWTVETKYGTLDITINLSKPEKDPKAIAAAGKAKSASYPKCQLCMENEGYAGRSNHPARENHRIIPITIQAAGDSSILLTFITTNTASYLTANMFR